MRARLVPLLLAAILVVAGLATVASVSPAETVPAPRTATIAAEDSPPSPNDTAPLTRAELFDAIGADASDHSAELYYVARNGSWFHASANGSVGSPAPHGGEVPRIVDETYEVPRDDRPTYVWKVVAANECSTTFYDAANASVVAPYAIPGCPLPAPTPTTTASPGTSSAVDGGTTTVTGTEQSGEGDTTTGGPLPGFGVAVSAGALLLAGWFVARRSP